MSDLPDAETIRTFTDEQLFRMHRSLAQEAAWASLLHGRDDDD